MVSSRCWSLNRLMAAEDIGIDITHLEQKTVGAVVDEFRHSADAGGDGGNAAGHGFECGEAEGLHLAGHEHKIGERKELIDVVLLADEVDAVLHVVFAGEIFGYAAVGTVADEHQARGNGFGDAGEDLERRPECV